jgi:GT2 family glycosyltransferase
MVEVMSTVTVVIPNYNGAHLLPDCLRSLREQAPEAPEIVVVDNSSIDESEAVAKEWGARWLPLGANRGLATACNAGARDTRTPFLFFANSDMRFAADCLEILVETLQDAGETAFSADPLQYDWEGDRIIHYRTVLRAPATLRERLAEGVFQQPPLVRSYTPAHEVCEIPWGCGGSLMVRSELFHAIGGFDGSFFLDFEDVDLCWRAAMRGWSHWFAPHSRLWHRWGASNDAPLRAARPDLARRLPPTERARLVSQAHNHVRFALKVLEPEHARDVVLAKLLAAASYVSRGRRARGIALAQGVFRALRAWPAIREERAQLCRLTRVSSRQLLSRFSQWRGPDALIWPAETSGEREPLMATAPRAGAERS